MPVHQTSREEGGAWTAWKPVTVQGLYDPHRIGGTIQPIAAIAALAHERGALMHTDAVQSAGKIPVDVRALGIDLLALSAHKFNGPKGAGALWIKRGTRMQPILTGGKHERNRRAGTESVAAIGLAEVRRD